MDPVDENPILRVPSARSRQKGLKGIALPVLSAILFAFCFPFASAWWLAWFALIPWYFALLQTRGNVKAGCASGFWFGLTLHLVGVFWMTKLGIVPWAVLAVFESASFALTGAIAAPLLFRLPTWGRPIAFAALWTVLEYGRSQGSMAFPWFMLAASQVPCLSIVQVVAVTGQWGLSFAIATVNGLLSEAYVMGKLRDTFAVRWLAGTAVYIPILLAVGGWFVLQGNPIAKNLPTRRLSIVQGNVGKISENATPEMIGEYRWQALNTYLQMTRYVAKQEPGSAFILWPETVVPGYLLQDPTLLTNIQRLARETKTNLLVGTMDAGDKQERFNSVVLLNESGVVRAKYAKQRIVPMGEFFPFRDVLGGIYTQYDVPNEDLTPGREPGVFTIGTNETATQIGMLICYESVFPYISCNRVREGAQVLVQATSDETFDDTPNPQQHADLAVLRAVETRRYFIRAGATGCSEVIDPFGHVLRKIPSQKAGTITEAIALRTGETFFVRFGDWFVACAGLLLLILGFMAFPKRPVPSSQTPSNEEVERPV